MGKACGWTGAGLVLIVSLQAGAAGGGAEVGGLLRRLQGVGREGAGNEPAQRAWRELVRRGPDVLIAVLAAWDEADPAAANWLRAAVDAIAEREVRAGRPLPARELEAFVRQRRHAGPARRLAYEWLTRVDPSAPGRLLPGMLQDPSTELRRDAVAVVLKEAQALANKGDRPAATAAFRKALAGARDRDQVEGIAQQLRALGVEVDLAAHFGFVRRWLLLGPFDHTGGIGWSTAYPPEKEIDLARTYRGKGGIELRWTPHATSDPYGLVDLNKAIGKQHGVVAYAFAAVSSPAERPVQLRAASPNAIQIFLNGQRIFTRDEYHHGTRMDQHVGMGTLRAGRNDILLKVCQNEQTEDWAQAWSFQLRVCDAVGGAVPLTVLAGPGAEVRP
jgi:hypothetical protein